MEEREKREILEHYINGVGCGYSSIHGGKSFGCIVDGKCNTVEGQALKVTGDYNIVLGTGPFEYIGDCRFQLVENGEVMFKADLPKDVMERLIQAIR